MDGSKSNVAIVGAGMAGLACATKLADAGLSVTLYDKGRGPGGRMAARRAEIDGDVVSFDHGAQYFTARDTSFQDAVAAWAEQGVVARWEAAGDEAWVGVPGMNGPIRAMADGLDVKWGTRIERIQKQSQGWLLEGAGEGETFLADIIVCAIPAEQAHDLLVHAAPYLAEITASARSAPCWAVMAAFKKRLDIETDAVRMENAPIAWAARNSAKPSRTGDETWVLHASPDRSRQLLNLSKDEAAQTLLDDFFQQTGAARAEPIHLVAHRWLYAMPEVQGEDHAHYNALNTIGIAGDYLHSPRVEGAFLSGTAMAERIIAAR